MKGIMSFLVVGATMLVAAGCNGPSAVLSPDGSKVAWATNEGLSIQGVGSAKRGKILVEGQVSAPAWSPDGQWLLFDRVVDPGDREHPPKVRATLFKLTSHATKELPATLWPPFAWSADGKSVYGSLRPTAKSAWEVVQWDLAAAAIARRWPVTTEPSKICVSGDRVALISGSYVITLGPGPKIKARFPEAEAIAFENGGSGVVVAGVFSNGLSSPSTEVAVYRVDAVGNRSSLLERIDASKLLSESGKFVLLNGTSLDPSGSVLLLSGAEDISPSGVLDAYFEYSNMKKRTKDDENAMYALEDQLRFRPVIVQVELSSGARRTLYRGTEKEGLELSTTISWSADGRKACAAGDQRFHIVETQRASQP